MLSPRQGLSSRVAMALLWLLSCLALVGSARATLSLESAWGCGAWWGGRWARGVAMGRVHGAGAARPPVPQLPVPRRLWRARHHAHHQWLQPHCQRRAGGARVLAMAGLPPGECLQRGWVLCWVPGRVPGQGQGHRAPRRQC